MAYIDTRPAARLGDIGSAHGCYPETPIIEGSADVICNGRPVARLGDALLDHGCSRCNSHPRMIAAGAAGVLVNGRPWARQGDAVDCGGVVQGGSGDVLIGARRSEVPGK
ncbi:PAAR domain-containing protein [Alkalilimnicola sp. S0819]|uniref:PAAR domain-containing protein n=1 Tax=Alkalilimnicola sp. S0819 TaxID=2613922 RepID=UPI00126208AF|nr:PAAR domain-containing protein [Alkalilimnicola sp. S0819]KAB7622613.1 hypothetical protein F3N43_12140 [Alkalilimnicola sp. S0819]MPQ17384.1 hypothetical protein [Alkalilimnicola sp. S0819]